MRVKTKIVGATAMCLCLAALSAAAVAQDSNPQVVPGPGCHFGEVIDGSTANDARTKIETAGYTDVHDLKKSCDNFWHGNTNFSGRPVNVVLSPGGKVMLESD